MASLSETRSILISMKYKMISVNLTLSEMKSTLSLFGEFEKELWDHIHERDNTTMMRCIHRYESAVGNNHELIEFYENCHFEWQNLIRSFFNNSLAWKRENLSNVNRQIGMNQEMIRLCEMEINRLAAAIENTGRRIPRSGGHAN